MAMQIPKCPEYRGLGVSQHMCVGAPLKQDKSRDRTIVTEPGMCVCPFECVFSRRLCIYALLKWVKGSKVHTG